MSLEDLSGSLTPLEMKAQRAAYKRIKAKEENATIVPDNTSADTPGRQEGEHVKGEGSEQGQGFGGFGGVRNDEYFASQVRGYKKSSGRYVAFRLADAVTKLNGSSSGSGSGSGSGIGTAEGKIMVEEVHEKGDNKVALGKKLPEHEDGNNIQKQSQPSAAARSTPAQLSGIASVQSSIEKDFKLCASATSSTESEAKDAVVDDDATHSGGEGDSKVKGWRTVDSDHYNEGDKFNTQDNLKEATNEQHLPATSTLSVTAHPSSSSSSSSASSSSSSSSWNLLSQVLNPFATKATTIEGNDEKSNTTDNGSKVTAAHKEYEEIPHSQRKNNELVSLLEMYWYVTYLLSFLHAIYQIG